MDPDVVFGVGLGLAVAAALVHVLIVRPAARAAADLPDPGGLERAARAVTSYLDTAPVFQRLSADENTAYRAAGVDDEGPTYDALSDVDDACLELQAIAAEIHRAAATNTPASILVTEAVANAAHVTTDEAPCWCRPVDHGDGVIVHRSWREIRDDEKLFRALWRHLWDRFAPGYTPPTGGTAVAWAAAVLDDEGFGTDGGGS